MTGPREKDVNLGLQRPSDTKGQMLSQSRPVTSRELEDLLKLHPKEAAQKLLHRRSSCLLVQKQEVQAESLMLLVQVLAHVAASSWKENIGELILLMCEQRFFDRMCSHTMRIRRIYPEKCHDFLKHLFILLEAYAEAMIVVAVDSLSNLIDICMAVLPVTEDADLLKKYEQLQKLILEEQQKWYNDGPGRKGAISLLDNAEPPEDFREVPSFPTCEELLKRRKPFFRRNVTKGAYKDNNHYLDVQFRLLREDFTRPLREGINDFKEGVRNRDIRVYKDVTISKPVIKQGEIMHIARVKLPKNISFKKSKRLMHENLLCLSNDGFKTLLLGTVADTDDLECKGFLGIKLISDHQMVDLKGSFVIIESKAYFMAYRYVLQGLKNLTDKVPFEPYIIHVNPNVDIPEYLRKDTLYDLRVVKDLGLMVKPAMVKKPTSSPLCNVPMRSDLDTWPTSEELGLDDSQRRALHNALTRCFAVIQGPPGTGKTFIGLKITQILLHNSHIWNHKVKSSPILIISFTNHALDQFLEGISEYTNKIVRVGSRTNSTTIARFQIKHIVRSLRITRVTREHGVKEIKQEIEHVEKKIKKLQVRAECLECPPGILRLNEFVTVIPKIFMLQLREAPLSLWLLDQRLLGEAKMNVKRQNKVFKPACNVPSDLQFEVTFESLEKQRKEFESNKNVLAQMGIHFLLRQMEALQIGLQIHEDPDKIVELEKTCDNVWRLGIVRRWQLYKHWVRKVRCQVLDESSSAVDSHRKLSEDLQKCKNELSLYAMKQASVVGMTTTAAARNAQVLKDLAPSIVIIEEAAEVLESHVVTSLTTQCKHVIQIGDHQQLRPSATVHELATKYELEISLFERMIRNGLPFATLEFQHRMRPSISTLLVPSIYPALKDSPSVRDFPHIRGLQKDVFFFSHTYPEEKKAGDDLTHENVREAQFLMGLCRHLMLQGYTPDEVTILAAYSGQFFLLRKLQQKDPECKDVKICVLDNFQGEENKIILLSLVRNNDKGVVGFLHTKNRVCVALSRAKHGFYIAGNMDMLTASSDLWRKIKQDLVKGESLGNALVLKCENHPENFQSVKCYEDFLAKSPNGGCLMQCGQKLPNCDHLCEWNCHMNDMQHTKYKCSKPCSKVRCDLNHPCPKLCWQKCGPCGTIVTKTFPCGHTPTLPCKEEACPTLVERVMAYCQHRVTVPCHSQEEVIPCPVECDSRLACSHMCRLKCHATEDPDHQNYICKKKCLKLRRGCTQDHRCPQTCGEPCVLCLIPVTKLLLCGHEAKQIECHLPVHEIRCSVKVGKILACGHEAQDVECSSIKSIKCTVLTTQTLPCGHEVNYAACGAATEEVLCRENCLEILDCGHTCKKLCHEECGDCSVKVSKTLACGHEAQDIECSSTTKNIKCTALTTLVLPCGHELDVACGTRAEALRCTKKCMKTLDCGHICKKLCSEICGGCLVKVEKTIPKCGHVIEVILPSFAWM
ncbi:NFX1-type zinc finger-containing protein 1-like isoform X1 [Penaeus chinensis]|uniref:NFX1-type zinc finger-containing protein 1-like isoform X1 n=1 Tax=Penaeus chinensis TaxID=139456 RepID=UPI001FB77C22|nr:NFX1-type zinc finger-containing protein 1-like isoform X1 [Penaeus chinensis]XP_047487945.1 NFX1-type zinc finger-containing protein 1-like isoform X1 [Penaeus chinensis]